MRSLLDRCACPTKGYAVAGKPDPLIVGATDMLLAVGEEPTDLSPTPLAGLHGGPGLHPHQDWEAAQRCGMPPSAEGDSSLGAWGLGGYLGPVGRGRSESSCSMTSVTGLRQPTGTLSRYGMADIY